MLIANGGIVVSEFVGIAAAFELFGVSKYLAVPIVGFVVWYSDRARVLSARRARLPLHGLRLPRLSDRRLPRPPALGDVAHQTVMPPCTIDAAYLFAIVTLIGTTITPYMQMYVQSATAEKGVSPEDFAVTRADNYFGSLFSNLVAIFIIIATGATLYMSGTSINDAADAAKALAPVAGPLASVLFGVGLLGASCWQPGCCRWPRRTASRRRSAGRRAWSAAGEMRRSSSASSRD